LWQDHSNRKEIEKESYEGKKLNKSRGIGYILHLEKVVKEKGKKFKVNNPCITSLKVIKEGRNPPSTLIHF
jgi:hypothetical protein